MKTETETEAKTAGDEHHTINDLYEHRVQLMISLMAATPKKSFWTKRDADGKSDDGWIIIGINTSAGQISYHCAESYIEQLKEVNIKEVGSNIYYDGHNSDDVLTRLRALREVKLSFVSRTLDYWLADYKCYRQAVGGRWKKVGYKRAPIQYSWYGTWERYSTKLLSFQEVVQVENY